MTLAPQPCAKAPAPDESAGGRATAVAGRLAWVRLCAPFVLLLAEIGLLTPFVEFTRPPMSRLASPALCMAVLLSLVTFLLLAGVRLRETLLASSFHLQPAVVYLILNLSLYCFFFQYTLWLHRDLSPIWAGLLLWAAVALGVGLAAFLVFFPLAALCELCLGAPVKTLAAICIGTGLSLATPWFQGFWPQVCGPALALDRQLLRWSYPADDAVVGRYRERRFLGATTDADDFPFLGTKRLVLLVTPQCSELEALPTLWILAAVAAVVRWRSVRKGRLLLVLAGGTVLLYVLIALRLFGLVVIGLNSSAQQSVSLAHSRISGMLFLALIVLLVARAVRRVSR